MSGRGAERRRLRIDLASQELSLLEGGEVVRRYPVSTARNGPGETHGSGCTPRGRHRIRIRIGAGAPEGAVFVGRRPTGERWSEELAAAQPLLARLREAHRRLQAGKRFGMPGFRPNEHYIREMQRFGILPKDLNPTGPVDPYATDRAYWDSFDYRPPDASAARAN